MIPDEILIMFLELIHPCNRAFADAMPSCPGNCHCILGLSGFGETDMTL